MENHVWFLIGFMWYVMRPFWEIILKGIMMIVFHMVMWDESRLDSSIVNEVKLLSYLKTTRRIYFYRVYMFKEVLSYAILNWEWSSHLWTYIRRCFLICRYVIERCYPACVFGLGGVIPSVYASGGVFPMCEQMAL